MRTLAISLAIFLLTAAARADWLPADLPFADVLGHPVTGLAAPRPSDVWAVAPYSWEDGSPDRVRWNTAVYHSRNDGLLWDLPRDAYPATPQFEDIQLSAVAFADRDHGWLFGIRRPEPYAKDTPPGPLVFLYTRDRGRTWTETTLPHDGTPVSSLPGFAIDAVDAIHAIAVAGNRVFETSDGTTWTPHTGTWPHLLAVQASGLPVPRAAGEDAGRAVAGRLGATGFVPETTAPGVFRALRFGSELSGWAAGGSDDGVGRIVGTRDGGKTWTTHFERAGWLFHGLAAPDAQYAWAVGERNGEIDRGAVWRTSDRGGTWSLDAILPGRLYAVAFRDSRHGWAAGEGGVWRYVPDLPADPGDLDRSGQVDAPDTAGLLQRAAGFRVAGPQDVPAGGTGPLSLVEAVKALRDAGRRKPVSADDPSGVVIVYNTLSADSDSDGVGDSLQVARHYALRRGVPDDRLVAISWPDPDAFRAHPITEGDGRANWTDAYRTVVEPLRARIDAIGRDRVHTILFTLGMPYTIRTASPDGIGETIPLDTSISDLYRTDAENWSSWHAFRAPDASVAERYARWRFGTGGRPMGQPVVEAEGVRRDPFYLVSRIDGPSLKTVLAMVDNAVMAEERAGPDGPGGTAYIDTRASRFARPPYPLEGLRAFTPMYRDYGGMDKSIARTILTFADRNLPWRDEVTSASIGGPPVDEAVNGPRWRDGSPATAAPNAMFYAGWYNYGQYYDAWDWLPGSVGIDYDSASADAFRAGTSSPFFAPNALARGLTALAGVIGEPYHYHPQPDALMEYLARGFTFAEAAMLATPSLRTGRALFLGDPLYRPFGKAANPSVPLLAKEG